MPQEPLDTPISDYVGQRVSELVHGAGGMTVAELARRSGLNRALLDRLLLGTRRVTVDDLVGLANALEVHVTQLLPADRLPNLDTTAAATAIADWCQAWHDLTDAEAEAVEAEAVAAEKRRMATNTRRSVDELPTSIGKLTRGWSREAREQLLHDAPVRAEGRARLALALRLNRGPR